MRMEYNEMKLIEKMMLQSYKCFQYTICVSLYVKGLKEYVDKDKFTGLNSHFLEIFHHQYRESINEKDSELIV